MLGAEIFVLEFCHFALGGVEGLAQIGPDLRRGASVHAGTAGEFGLELLLKGGGSEAEFFQQRPGQAFGLLEQGKKEMLGGNFRMIFLGGQINRSVEGFLHFRSEFVGTHEKALTYLARPVDRELRKRFRSLL